MRDFNSIDTAEAKKTEAAIALAECAHPATRDGGHCVVCGGLDLAAVFAGVRHV